MSEGTLHEPRSDTDAGSPEPLDRLTRRIVDTHHRYIRNAVPAIAGQLLIVAGDRGGRDPDVMDVQRAFAALGRELLVHLEKEENILFPYIEELARAERGGPRPRSPFGTVRNPIRVMEADHDLASTLQQRIRTATRDFTPPEDSDEAQRRCWRSLAEFDADLTRHIHAENDILFPRALGLEIVLNATGQA